MTLKSYIRDTITNFFIKGSIVYSDEILDDIEGRVNNGVYAFQVIYIPGDGSFYKLKLLKPLDYTLVKYNKEYDTYSYDGGKTYKYSTYETLIFDLRIIRELKLNNLLD
jgi:hypothetical protein